MSEAKKFRVQSKIARVAFGHGGITANRALRQADLALEPLREPCLAQLDAALADINARYGPDALGREAAPFEPLYQLSARVIELSLFAPNSGLEDAGRALCTLVDLMEEAGQWSWVSVDVHIQTLNLLRASGPRMTPAQRETLLAGLGKVSSRMSAPRGPETAPAA